jgi:inorganic triphosphatase YgiF
VTATEPHEIELKFAFDDADALRDWLDETFPLARGDGWKTHEITDVYFDTADQALKDAGYGARLRTIGSLTTLTLKSNVEVSGGLHRRLELEAPATKALDTERWPDSEARSRVIDVVGARRLIESFVIGQQRRERYVSLGDSTAVASLDQGEVEYLGIAAGELQHLEIELREGEPAALRAVARQVARSGLATAEDHSKLELAKEMVEAVARVAPDDSWADAARKLLRKHLLRMLEREGATRAGDANALKQMRVATRRMRATWRVFGNAFAGAHAQHFDANLRHVAELLGAVRDLDVLLNTVGAREDVAAMAASWRARRDAAFDELMRHIDSRAYERFVDDFLEGTGARAFWHTGKHAHDKVAERATPSLERARDRMMAAADAASDSNEAAAWHQLRIAAKKMRYSLEAFRDVLDERAATDFIERLRAIQDNLGEMNDASVAAREAASWLTSAAGADAPPGQRVAVARYIGQSEGAVARKRADFATLWPALASSSVPPLVHN